MTDARLQPTPARFRALARSSPWRWSSIQFEWKDRGAASADHVWIRRPDRFRIEGPDGTLRDTRVSTRAFEGSFYKEGSKGKWLPTPGIWPSETEPALNSEGLVTDRPGRSDIDFDAPFYTDYHWVAMLDPAELTDRGLGGTDDDQTPPVELTGLRAVTHHGRAAWEATATPTPNYDPRCSCCSLLAGEPTDDQDRWISESSSTIRLDVETAVCVFIEHLDDPPRVDLDIKIIDVDGHYDDSLFRKPRSPWSRLLGPRR
ncbi:hypothetical protein CJ178_31090 [Rhodococcus sp. ACPA4]|uniref:hypothetical protein n=1 Tax=Rhodococcus sp. ACPA4 TaxID=2028571 RepID=UPI000BB0DE2E|nr:hypothetical protein [Rhodococcus sp. ACPA4]PBC35886.1 hypothetical protein CJ178_31090 [Rhodococcus sp. ACPA4]